MKIVTFYTPHYGGEVHDWYTSCNHLQIEHEATEVEDQGSWRLNVGMKPAFILDRLHEHDCPILWLDVDARVLGDLPILSELYEYDFAAWFIPWDQMRPVDRPGGAKTQNDGVASGTLWFHNTPAAKRFLELWISREHGQGRYGQVVLGETWHFHRDKEHLQTKRLPQAYCKVFDRDWKRGESGPIQIEHTQASRRLRK